MVFQANLTDLDSIFNLVSTAAEKGSVLPRSKETLKDFINSFFVYKVNGEVVGCASLEVYTERLAEVRSVCVKPEFKGKGVGTALIKACVDKASSLGLVKVLAVTDKDVFFEKQGFEKCLGGQWAMFYNFGKANQ